MVCEIAKLNLSGCHRGPTGLLGLAGAGLDHINVGSCSSEEDEDEWPDLKGLIGIRPRDVCSAIGKNCCRADTVWKYWTFQPSENIVFLREGLNGHEGRAVMVTNKMQRMLMTRLSVVDRRDFISTLLVTTPLCWHYHLINGL